MQRSDGERLDELARPALGERSREAPWPRGPADRGMSANAIAGVIADGYGRGAEHWAVDAANARYAALRALGEEARGLEERIVALARAHLCPHVPVGESYTVRIENDGVELVAR